MTASSTSNRPWLGTARAYWLATVVCMGAFLFGYDSGIVGGVVTFPSFMKDFEFSKREATRDTSLVVSLQQGGAFFGCLLIWPFTNKYGRRIPLSISAFVFIVGAMIETIRTHSLAAFYVGRIVAGLGLGAATVIVPMFNSEMAPKEMRGQVGCFFQWFYTWGIFTSYWVNYGVKKDIPAVPRQWQIPVGLQILPAGLLCLGVLTLKESTRWLTSKGRHEEALKSLIWMRGGDGPSVRAEMEEIRAGIEIELEATRSFTLLELLQWSNFKLLLVAFVVFLAQQSTGATAFAYYAPSYFALIVGSNNEESLLLSGIFGAVKVVACGFFVFVLSERVGRRITLIVGAAGMAACQIIAAALVKTHPATGTTAHPHTSSSGIATIAMIYLFVIIYNMSWGALPWPYVSEIFPIRIRAPGIATGVASQWLFAFVFTLATPSMVKNIGWGTFLLWGLFNVVICGGSFFLKETKGKSLEEINAEEQGHEDRLANKIYNSGASYSGDADSDPSQRSVRKSHENIQTYESVRE